MQSSNTSEPLRSTITPSIDVGPSMIDVPSSKTYAGMSRFHGDAVSGVGVGNGSGVWSSVAVGAGLRDEAGLSSATSGAAQPCASARRSTTLNLRAKILQPNLWNQDLLASNVAHLDLQPQKNRTQNPLLPARNQIYNRMRYQPGLPQGSLRR